MDEKDRLVLTGVHVANFLNIANFDLIFLLSTHILSVCRFVGLFVIFFCLSCLSVCPSVCMSVLCTVLYVCTVSVNIGPSASLSALPPVCLLSGCLPLCTVSVCRSACLSVRLYVCMSLCLYMYVWWRSVTGTGGAVWLALVAQCDRHWWRSV